MEIDVVPPIPGKKEGEKPTRYDGFFLWWTSLKEKENSEKVRKKAENTKPATGWQACSMYKVGGEMA